LFNFKGRTARREFWRVYLLLTLLIAVVWVGGLFAVLKLGSWAGFAFLLLAPIAVMYLALMVRRLHDRNRGAVWAAVYLLGPFLLDATAQSLARTAYLLAALLALSGLGLAIWSVVDMGFLRGTAGANRYGVDPQEVLPIAAAL
jgi:uncharacterized membrane protein YhaH (DUF805 family)